MELNYKFGRLPSYTRLTFIVSAIVLFSISIQLYQHEQSFENLKREESLGEINVIDLAFLLHVPYSFLAKYLHLQHTSPLDQSKGLAIATERICNKSNVRFKTYTAPAKQQLMHSALVHVPESSLRQEDCAKLAR
jgi:hypothetical protein